VTVKSALAPPLARNASAARAIPSALWGSREERARWERWAAVLLIVGVIALVYRSWLSSGVVSSGDWTYGADAHLRDLWPFPSVWDDSGGTGSSNILGGPLAPLISLQGLLAYLGIGYATSERLVWIFPCLLAGSFATYALVVSLYASRLAGVVAALFVAFNFYIVSIMGGGQFTVSSGSLLMPVVLWLFYRALTAERASVPRFVLTALIVGVQIMYDLRSTYLTVATLMLFALFHMAAQPSWRAAARALGRVVAQFAVVGVVAVLMNLHWLLPGRFAEAASIGLPSGYDALGWVHALSYFHLNDGFAFFHPARGPYIGLEYFLLPLVVLVGLTGLTRRRLTSVDLFLFALALISIFFVKGSNDPGGGLYEWMFRRVPGFNMYRDPSKFFQPLSLAYALLLGRAVAALPGLRLPRVVPSSWAPASRLAARGAMLLVCLVPVFSFVLPVATGSPYGTFAPIVVPAEYKTLERFMAAQPSFFRTLWLYGLTPYIGNSALHPAIGADSVGQQMQDEYIPLPNPTDTTTWLALPRARAILQTLSVKYVAIGDNQTPGDTARTTALNKVAQSKFIRLARQTFPGFTQSHIGNVVLFANPRYIPPVYVANVPTLASDAHGLLRRSARSPLAGVARAGAWGEYASACAACAGILSDAGAGTRFELVVHADVRPFLLVLNQSFDPNWAAYLEPAGGSQPFWWTWTHPAVLHTDHVPVNGYANAWLIDRPGTYRIVVEYWPQRLTDVGFIVLWLTILSCVAIAASPVVVAWLRRAGAVRATPAVERMVAVGETGHGSRLRKNGRMDRQSAR